MISNQISTVMDVGKCRLCLQEKPLLNKSHIIPDFMYRHGKIYHDDHTIHKIDLRQTFQNNFTKFGRQRNGEYEGNLLCQNCDSKIIKEYEDYAKMFLYERKFSNKNQLLYSFPPGEVIIKNINYRNLKLFFLSIFWRAAISSRPFFKEIVLDQYKLEELREMIHTGNPKSNTDYAMLFMLDAGDDQKLKQYIGQPVSGAGNNSFIFVFPGILVYYFFDLEAIPNNLLRYQIFDSGEIRFMKLSGNQIWELLKYLYG